MFRFLVLFTCCVLLCVGYKEAGACPENERYSSCTQAECRALNCTQKDQPVLCVLMDPQYCKKGCICKEGYLRNDDGICVLEDKCELGACPDNERYSTCTQAECRALNCIERDQPVLCVRMDPRFCKKGCVCKAGYLRNNDGICVLEDKCEQPGCTGENEVYTDCKESCPPEVCFSVVAFYDCSSAEPCTKGCACKPGYLRKEMDSPCIPTCKCPELEDTQECKAKA